MRIIKGRPLALFFTHILIDFRDKCASKPVPAHDGKPCISWYRKVVGQISSALGYPCNLNLLFASQGAPDSHSEHLELKNFLEEHAPRPH